MKFKLLLFVGCIAIYFTSCKNGHYEIYNQTPLLVDISELINSGKYELDSCNKRLNRIKRVEPKNMTEQDETMLQIKLKRWKINYNKWLLQNNRDTITFNEEFLFERTSYQYTYFITEKPVDVYRLDSRLRINGIENIQLFIQVDEAGDFISDFSEVNFVDTPCDKFNAVEQDIYTLNKASS